MPTWDDRQYLKFADQRTRPAAELLARVPNEAPGVAVDLGCGPGNSTELLVQRWPGAKVTGVDSSPEMLRAAREAMPGVAWQQADAGLWEAAEPPDVLYANALLQWLPSHRTLVPRLFAQLAPGGTLAFQVPRNFEAPSHRLMREVAGPWSAYVPGARAIAPIEGPDFYYDLLANAAAHIDTWHTTYEHVMADATAIVEWVKGTGLRPYLEAIPEALRPGYLEAYTAAINEAYPPRADGKRLFSFPRLFFVATKP